MIPGMETLHDVLRFIVSKLRGVASDQQVEQALTAIAAHEAGLPAASATPVSFAEAYPSAADQLSRLDTAIGQLAAQVSVQIGELAAQVHALSQPAQAPPTVPDPVPPAAFHQPEQGGF